MGMIEVSEEQKKVFIKTCEKYIKNGGSGCEADCGNCPFSYSYQDNRLDCVSNGYATNNNSKDPKLVESAKRYIEENKPPEITLEQALKVVEK